VPLPVKSLSQTAAQISRTCSSSDSRITPHPSSTPKSLSYSLLITHYSSLFSRHHRALNLITPTGDILGIVWPELGNGPFHMVLAEPVSFYDLDLQTVEFDLSAASLWDAGLISDENSPQRAQREQRGGRERSELARLLEERLAERAADGETLTFEFPSSAVEQLLHGLSAGDRDAITAGALRLAGLGPGLTPAGDDFLVGVMAGIWLFPHRLAATLQVESACQWITDVAAPRTTTLSRAWLRHAARGEFSEAWHILTTSLQNAKSAEISHAVEKILSFGATSGADALYGLHCWLTPTKLDETSSDVYR
jgi:hypothetical protein